jgi:acyl-CoA thioester hydrolase
MTETVDPPCFRQTVRVYWEDTDAGGVVFFANYLKFFERARTEWLRALGYEQQRLLEDGGSLFVVSETSVRYLRPARLDDLLDVTVAVREAARVSLVIEQQVWRCTTARDGELLAQGTIRVGCVDAKSFKPRRIPDAILQSIQ